jgi:hypothetical protein
LSSENCESRLKKPGKPEETRNHRKPQKPEPIIRYVSRF